MLRRSLPALAFLGLAACNETIGPSDVTPPVVALTLPAANTLDLTGAVALAATAADSAGVALMQFFVDGVSVGQDATDPYGATLPATAAYTSGAHVIGAAARDVNGNWSDTASALVTFGGTVALPAGFTRLPFVTGLGAQATAIAAAADGRIFVTEKSGAIRVIKNGTLLAQPFATLPVLLGSERGLLGIALSPGLGITGHVYVYYTTAAGVAHNRISRFVALSDIAGAAEEILMELPALSTAENHNAGAMAFGPDGKLYVAVGDNANDALAPQLTSRLGKILRLNPDGSIPTDNPFLGVTTGLNGAIWARGLRNPYTFAFDRLTGVMFINDVGQQTWEEINRGSAGADFGWPATEGPTSMAGVTAPFLAYKHTASPTLFEGAAIVGAAFYRPGVPLLGAGFVGDYFFADFSAGWIYRLAAANEFAPAAFALNLGNPTNLVVGADGALYVTIGNRVDRIAR